MMVFAMMLLGFVSADKLKLSGVTTTMAGALGEYCSQFNGSRKEVFQL